MAGIEFIFEFVFGGIAEQWLSRDGKNKRKPTRRDTARAERTKTLLTAPFGIFLTNAPSILQETAWHTDQPYLYQQRCLSARSFTAKQGP